MEGTIIILPLAVVIALIMFGFFVQGACLVLIINIFLSSSFTGRSRKY